MNRRGSNQYQVKHRGLKDKTWISVNFVCLLLIPVVYFGGETADAKRAANIKIISPLATTAYAISDESLLPQYKNSTLAQPDSHWMAFRKRVEALAPIYGFPVKVIVAQAALESNRGRSEFARERHNYFGLAAYDSNPNSAWSFENADQAIITYMQTIKRNFPEAYQARGNPERMIELLKNNKAGTMYATDPHYVAKIKSLPEWNN